MPAHTADHPLAIGLVGCGNAGLPHGRQIAASPQWRLASLCDVRQSVLDAAAAELDPGRTYTDYEQMLQEEKLDAVAVVTPGHVHVDQVVAAAEHNLHVLCEKPLGIAVDDCERAVAACREAGVLLGVTFTYRFVRDFRIMKSVVDSGEIGDVREVRWLRYGKEPAVARENPPEALPDTHRDARIPHLFDCGIHAFDLMRWFVGAPAVDIKAHATAAAPGWEPGAVTIVFTYADGQRGVYDSGAMAALPGCDRGQPALSFLVAGTLGSMAWDFKGGWGPRESRTRIAVHSARGTRVERVPVYTKCRDVQYAEFARAIRAGRLPPHWPTTREAIDATALAVDALDTVYENRVFLTEFA